MMNLNFIKTIFATFAVCLLIANPAYSAKYFVTVNYLKYRVDDVKEEAVCVGMASETSVAFNLSIPAYVSYKNKKYPVTEIASEAFRNDKKIKNIISLPNTLIKIGAHAFYFSNVSGRLTLPSSLRIIEEGAFGYCRKLTGSLIFPDSVEEIGEYAFHNCEGFKGKLKLGKKVKIIGGSAFHNCSGLTGSLIIPDNVKYIGEFAFAGCDGFTENLIIGNSVEEIGESAFGGCENFRGELTIGQAVIKLGRYAFSGCRGLCGSIIIPDSVVEIEDGVFNNCTGFDEKLIIGKSMAYIGHSAFAGCYHIQEIICRPITPPKVYHDGGIDKSIFEKITLYVPLNSVEAYHTSNTWSKFKNIKPISE